MLAFRQLDSCRLRFLRQALDDPDAQDCGRCDRCCHKGEPDYGLDETTIAAAHVLLRGSDVILEPRKQWPSGLDEPSGKLAPDLRPEQGRALARLGDGGWDSVIEKLFTQAEAGQPYEIPDDLVLSFAGVLKRWNWPMRPTWICPVPSRRRPSLISDFADAIGELGVLPVHHALQRTGHGGWQADQSNSAHQVSNVWGHLEVHQQNLPASPHLDGPVLLLDDEATSRWTLTICSVLLRSAGTGPVLPAVLPYFDGLKYAGDPVPVQSGRESPIRSIREVCLCDDPVSPFAFAGSIVVVSSWTIFFGQYCYYLLFFV